MSEGYPTQFAKRFSLREARLNRGLSARQVALEIGIAQETFRRLEDGEPVHPSSAKKVADYFGVRVTDLMPAQETAA